MNSQVAVNATLRNKINTPTPEPVVQHRFLPGENPRSVSTPKTSQPKLAGEVGFAPVATISVASGDTYVRAVKNTSQRSVSPTVVNKDGQVSIKGAGLIELASNLHEQIKAKVNQGTVYQKQTLVAPPAQSSIQRAPEPSQPKTAPAPTLTTEQAKARSEDLKKQLEGINKVLFEQLRQKISLEIANQQTQPNTKASNEAKTMVFKTPRVSNQNTAAPTLQKPISQPPVNIQTPQTVATRPAGVSQINQPQQTLVQPHKPELPKRLVVGTSKPKEISEPTANLQSHIENLEREIETLTKEVLHIDTTISNLEKERSFEELSALEQKLAYDEKMMQAVSDWKYTLTNLVNSHSIALKYLKQKTDWLTDKVENIEGHREKHERMHRKPREISFKLEGLEKPRPVIEKQPETIKIVGVDTGNIDALPTRQISSPINLIKAQEPAGIKINLPADTVGSNAAVIQSTVTQPPEIKEIVRKEEAQPEQVQAAVEKAILEKTQELQPKVIERETVKEVQNLDNDRVQTLINAAVEKQMGQSSTSTQEIEKIVSEALKKQAPQTVNQLTAAQSGTTSIPTNVSVDSLQQSSAPGQANIKAVATSAPANDSAATIEVPANISVGQPRVLPGNPTAQINIQAIPVQTTGNPTGNLPTIATGATMSLQGDIEKQILETAAKEEAAKEAIRTAKEELQQKKRTEEEKQKELAQSKNQAPEKTEAITQESLKEDLIKLKNSLTTAGNKSLEALSKEERSQMLQNLEALGRQSEVSRQFDEIKAVAQRRRINSELQTMLAKMGEKPAAVKSGQPPKTGSNPTNTQVEALKVQEKKERSPEEKAKIIAEIKGLERQREARKLEERSRPVVKAVPAYGKMLPNTPTVPNVINGIVKNIQGLLMDTVVIIVKDQEGDPVRAFKTNKIGQFAVSTPLPNGVYTLELEKPGFDFDIIEVEVNGGILPPIEIKAR